MKLLRMHAVYTKARGAVVGDDVDVTTHDFEILDATWPDAGTAGLTHNMAQLEADYIAFWDRCRGAAAWSYDATTAAISGAAVGLAQFRWYREDDGTPPFGDAARIVDITRLPGTGTTCPPQVACTVTEQVDSRRHWGRFYIPGVATSALAADGALTASMVNRLGAEAKVLYDLWRTRGVRPIVLGTTPVTSGSIRGTTIDTLHFGYHVIGLRADDVLDVQRRRRFQTALTRKIVVTANP